ncbi:hypothetical protein Tco_0374228 [Tanacetum coccineum]
MGKREGSKNKEGGTEREEKKSKYAHNGREFLKWRGQKEKCNRERKEKEQGEKEEGKESGPKKEKKKKKDRKKEKREGTKVEKRERKRGPDVEQKKGGGEGGRITGKGEGPLADIQPNPLKKPLLLQP